MYEHMTDEYLLSRMKGAVNEINPGISADEGTLVHDALAPAAIILAEAYAELDAVLDLVFAETSEGEYLDRRTNELAVTRKAASPASVLLNMQGPPRLTIPIGSVFSTPDAVLFESTAPLTLSDVGSGQVAAQAAEGGENGNVAAGSITEVVSYDLQTIVTVTNPGPATGGTEEEGDEALLARYLQRIREPITSGNAAQYEYWALEVQGVGAAKCVRIWDGPGTVKVIIVNEERQPVDQAVIDRCAEHIDEVRPIGAEVTVVSAQALPVNVNASVSLDPAYSLEGITSDFRGKLEEYLANGAFVSDRVTRTEIGAMLINLAGVLDYSDLLINEQGGNVAIPVDSVAVLGAVVLST